MHRRRFLGVAAGVVAAAALPARAANSTVNEAGYFPIGGIEQWTSLQGDARENPAILVAHGGPGEAQWLFAEHYRPWYRPFTVAQWDQRGAGYTFARYGTATPEVNLDRIVRDGIEVAEHVLSRLAKTKLIVLGHSWGSTVAVNMVQRRPELFAAMVGTGQVASWHASVQMQFDVLLAKARADKDTASIAMLEAIGKPDPTDAKQYFGFSKKLLDAMAPADRDWLKKLRASSPAELGVSPEDLKALGDGMNFTGERVLPDQMKVDLPATAGELKVPFFLIQGRDDIITPTPAAVDYATRLKAPKKEIVLIEGAGHFAYLTHGAAFLRALEEKVRPVALAGGA